jgi:beta-glucuronidase
MLRTFSQHEIRPTESLGGWWEFTTAAERTDRAKLPKTYARTMHVPGAWEQLPGLESYRGRAWFRRWFFADGLRAVRLVFGGVSHTADVYVDGRHVGHHYDAFTPFSVVVPALKEGRHELVVEVDNSFGAHSALHKENDYYTYGGITRPGELQWVPEVYLDQLFATPARRGRRWDLDVRVRVANCGRRTRRARVSVCIPQGLDVRQAAVDLGEVTVRPRQSVEVRGRLRNLDVEPWSPHVPSLYPLYALLAEPSGAAGAAPCWQDDLQDRVGFREVKVRGRRLLLNGKPIRLRGYNRHEDHPQFGCGIPLEAMVADLEILRDLGCNFLRTCHYPNDMRFLDLCDELGFCVWEESHARCVDFAHPRFRSQIAESTREMIEWHGSHPCILLWGCLNECDSVSSGGRREHARVIKLIRELDGSRPVTFASNKAQRDVCLDLVDVVSWNRYVGWYGGRVEEVEADLAELMKWLHSDASGGKGKPVILSEFGAGALRGCRHPHQAKWTEEHQARALDEQLRVYLNHPHVVGASIWQFCDGRVTNGHFASRPRTMNNKGTVDEFRRPKLAYETVRRRMREAAEQWDAPDR